MDGWVWSSVVQREEGLVYVWYTFWNVQMGLGVVTIITCALASHPLLGEIPHLKKKRLSRKKRLLSSK